MITYNEEIAGIDIKIIKKINLKNLYVRINPPTGDVVVSCPMHHPDEQIKLFILKKIPEITKVRDKLIAQNRQSKREYVSGEAHYLWGKPYRLEVLYEGRRCEVIKKVNKIILKVPTGTSVEKREKTLNEWYRKELKRMLEVVLPRQEKTTNLKADEYRIKNMKTRWGTCNIDKKRIWINLQLVKKPVECLEYVVVHELVHLIEKNHTHRFHSLVNEYYPTWKDAKKLLSEMPLDYLEKMRSDE